MSASVFVKDQNLELLSYKAIYWPKHNLLLLADLHLGKTNHFRRSGIAVPNNPNEDNLERFIKLLQSYKPARVLFMGDLFHSHYNQEWEVFGQTLKNFPEISFELIMGNHDILSEYQYLKHALLIHEQPIVIDEFILSHEPLDEIPPGLYNLAGHIHPGVSLRGRGRQGITLPCFWFGEQQALLPAFGAFTGLAKQMPKEGDQVFVVVEDQVVKVS